MKTCTHCKKEYPYSLFSKNSSQKDGYGTQCKSCQSYYQKLRYERNIAFVQRFKMLKGCCKCGYKQHPAALGFDHLDPDDKVRSSGNGAAIHYLSSRKKIKEEIRKCVVLCANCHNIKTNNNGDHKNRFPKNNKKKD